jgi:hypothetical protein
MAIQEIISAIDAYIAGLKAARDLLASPYAPSETTDRKPLRRKSRGNPQSIQLPVAPLSPSEVAVQIVPARMPRQRRQLERPVSQTSSALGGPVPKGPVVIRSSDLARMQSGRSQTHPTVPRQQTTASRGALEELAQEVAKRLASSGGFHHRA